MYSLYIYWFHCIYFKFLSQLTFCFRKFYQNSCFETEASFWCYSSSYYCFGPFLMQVNYFIVAIFMLLEFAAFKISLNSIFLSGKLGKYFGLDWFYQLELNLLNCCENGFTFRGSLSNLISVRLELGKRWIQIMASFQFCDFVDFCRSLEWHSFCPLGRWIFNKSFCLDLMLLDIFLQIFSDWLIQVLLDCNL